jgi:hypothetical protein
MCVQKSKTVKATNNPKATKNIEASNNIENIQTNDSIIKVTESYVNKPCIELQEFAAEIEKIGWVPEPERIKKISAYKHLNKKNIKHFGGKPFYKINFKNSMFNKAYSNFKEKMSFIDYQLFENVNSIWSYFYRSKKNTNTIPDGIIEQWEFDNKENAMRALSQLMRIDQVLYFNTSPYFCKIDNKVIIFHTRAMAFSFQQKELFEMFKNKMNRNVK